MGKERMAAGPCQGDPSLHMLVENSTFQARTQKYFLNSLCMCACVYVCVCIYIYVCVRVCVCVFIHTYINIYIYVLKRISFPSGRKLRGTCSSLAGLAGKSTVTATCLRGPGGDRQRHHLISLSLPFSLPLHQPPLSPTQVPCRRRSGTTTRPTAAKLRSMT